MDNMHPYFLDQQHHQHQQHQQHHEVTARQRGYQAAHEERRNYCSEEMNEATLIESSSTVTSTTTSRDSSSIGIVDNSPTYSGFDGDDDTVSGTFVQSQFHSATADATAPSSSYSSMLITEESTPGIPSDIQERLHTGRYSRGDDTSNSDEGIREVQRLDTLDLMNSHGDEDFEFLRSIINAAEAPSAAGLISMPAMIPHTPMITHSSPLFLPPSSDAEVTESRSDVPALYELVEEQKLRIADKVAACIWLAGERFQGGLFARATDTWAMIEAEQPVIPAMGRSLSEEIADRLETTRQAVEAQLKVADDVNRVRGRTPIVEPDWRTGSSILRGEVITRLEMLRIGNFMGGSPFSVGECNHKLVERLRNIREAVIGNISENHKAAMTAAGVHGTQFSPVISDDEVLMGIDSMVQSLLQQLKATYISFEDALQPAGIRRHPAPHPSWFKIPEDTQDGSKSDSSMSDTPSSINPGKVPGIEPGAARKNKRRKPGSGGRRCKNEDCSLHPHFGFTRPEYCSRHKLPGMFNVKGRRCSHTDCSRTPVYGKRGDPHPTYCAAHKLVNMVDIKNPTCREPSCSRQPSFGSPQDRRATYCATHMEEGMVNVRRMLASSRASLRNSKAAITNAGAAKATSTYIA